MLTFLRNRKSTLLKEDRLITYLFYESGEILLIAIGIMNLTAYPGIKKFLIETLEIYPSITSGLMNYSRQVIKEIDESN